MPKRGGSKGVIVTRPEPGLTETCAAVQKAGWVAYPSPSLCVTARTLAPIHLKTIVAVLLTSGQAISALCGKIPLTMPFYVVGARTAERVRQKGFIHVESADGNAEDLIKLVCQRCNPLSGSLLLATGRGHGTELASTLRQSGFHVIRKITYETQAISTIDPSIINILEQHQVEAILFFSAQSASRWFKALPRCQQKSVRNVRAVVISQAVAHVLEHLQWQAPISIASHPNATDVITALGCYTCY